MNKTQELIRKLKGTEIERRTPIATDMFIPNHSGDHSRGKVRDTPSNNQHGLRQQLRAGAVFRDMSLPGRLKTRRDCCWDGRRGRLRHDPRLGCLVGSVLLPTGSAPA